MNILALDTSSKACSIAIAVGDQIYSKHLIAPMQQSQLILPLINELLKSADLHSKDINAIAFGRGPGSFTGIRIAVSVAQGLGYAHNIPLIPISSLAILAQTSYQEKGWQKIQVVTDARLNEIYTGSYQVNSKGLAQLMGDEKVIPPQNLTLPNNTDWYGAGDGWISYHSKISCQVIEMDGNCLPNATAMISLAKDLWESGQTVPPEAACPVYLRDNVAIKSNKR